MALAAAAGLLAALGLFLCALGLAALLKPALARRFLMGFAKTPARHAAELVLRMLAGASFWILAPRLPAAIVFHVAGGVLLATTAAMALLPWRRHQRFAARSVPAALACLPWIGLASVAMGGGLLYLLVQPGVLPWRGGTPP